MNQVENTVIGYILQRIEILDHDLEKVMTLSKNGVLDKYELLELSSACGSIYFNSWGYYENIAQLMNSKFKITLKEKKVSFREKDFFPKLKEKCSSKEIIELCEKIINSMKYLEEKRHSIAHTAPLVINQEFSKTDEYHKKLNMLLNANLSGDSIKGLSLLYEIAGLPIDPIRKEEFDIMKKIVDDVVLNLYELLRKTDLFSTT